MTKIIKRFIRKIKKPNKKELSCALPLSAETVEARKRILLRRRNERYRVSALCPYCGCTLSEVYIIDSLRSEKGKYRLDISCPECPFRHIIPYLIVNKRQMRFYSYPVALSHIMGQLRDRDDVSADDIREAYPAVYYSTLFHFGSVDEALQLARETSEKILVR